VITRGPLAAIIFATVVTAAVAAVAALATPRRVATAPEEIAPMKRDVTLYGYGIVRSYPHDPGAFTQGLVFHDGRLYEGTGQEGESSLREVELETGNVLRQIDLAPDLFGEGIAIWRDSVIQLTWEHGVAFVYDLGTFELRKSFPYEGEGWGLTHDGSRFVMSNGTSTLIFRDPETFRETGRVDVTLRGRRLEGLNELEHIDGRIWANVWMTNQIVIIDPVTGAITGVVDLTGILTPRDRGGRNIDVLNGIAHDPSTGRIFVTGKYWPRLYEIRLVRE
jgi:glutaminyl-peptide cyclotransferase